MSDVNTFVVIIPGDEQAGDSAGLLASARRIAAASMPGKVHAIVLGSPGEAAMPQKLLAAGASSVLLVSHESLIQPVQGGQLLDLLLAVLSDATQDSAKNKPSLFLFAASPLADEIAAGAAFRTGGTALGRCSSIEMQGEQIVASRAAFGGRIKVDLSALALHCFACIRPGEACVPVQASDATVGQVREITLCGALSIPLNATFEAQPASRRRVDAAKVVVSGGRGMGGPEGFEQLDALASALDGALAGSLPAVDAGWVPVTSQVGQSGNYVTPLVYVAVGISGTLQHLAGIGPNVRIVAINNDPEANIFQEAQLGVVADWRVVVPLITAHLRAEAAN
ncbi:MAG: electron transfer flavoprotein subunit alpha/FixB family protein [Polaromonas sp.]|uniref:electron transfer flavoprotein subunit alpha/FixB family protein n=1 Tax=Polaromonas sp. TaxID=1869339 RepID=UPI0025F31023|nr:electron transfer flavoprotein subunit alpha/FixB family protein [Polaromonas sp.]MBI2727725.1 electron transfer flavoprotein subunit alpha/FixB family protein [Polaromonas sp.]